MKGNREIRGKRYKHKSSAQRALHNFQVRFFVSIRLGMPTKHFQFWITKVRGRWQISGQKD